MRPPSMPDGDAHTAWLNSETDVAGFRSAARSLIAQGIEPQRVSWQIANAVEGDLFAATPPNTPDDAHRPEHAPLQLPLALVALCERAALHRDPQRHALVYRLVWRLAHEPGLRDDPLDPDRLQIE